MEKHRQIVISMDRISNALWWTLAGMGCISGCVRLGNDWNTALLDFTIAILSVTIAFLRRQLRDHCEYEAFITHRLKQYETREETFSHIGEFIRGTEEGTED